jgi:hypothetical protein
VTCARLEEIKAAYVSSTELDILSGGLTVVTSYVEEYLSEMNESGLAASWFQ